MSKMANQEVGQVSGIEMSDLNDGDIINGTGQELSTDKSQFRFTYTLPSGRVITSEWISSGADQRQLRRLWLESVKGQILADAQSAQEATMKQAREKQMASTSLDVPVLVPKAVADLVPDDTPEFDDPKQLIVRRIIQAQERAERAEWEYNSALQSKNAAEAALKKWSKLLEAVG